MNNLYSSPKKVYGYTLHNFTVLLKLDLEKKCEICKVFPLGGPPPGPPWGHMYHMITFASPAPEDDSCQVWLKSNHAVLQEVDEQLLFT